MLEEDLEMFVIRDEHSMCVLVMSFEIVIPYLKKVNKHLFTKMHDSFHRMVKVT